MVCVSVSFSYVFELLLFCFSWFFTMVVGDGVGGNSSGEYGDVGGDVFWSSSSSLVRSMV